MDLKLVAKAALGLSLVSVWTWQHDLVGQAQKVQIPIFEYDPTFPKPLPRTGLSARSEVSPSIGKITSTSCSDPEVCRRMSVSPARTTTRRRPIAVCRRRPCWNSTSAAS